MIIYTYICVYAYLYVQTCFYLLNSWTCNPQRDMGMCIGKLFLRRFVWIICIREANLHVLKCWCIKIMHFQSYFGCTLDSCQINGFSTIQQMKPLIND